MVSAYALASSPLLAATTVNAYGLSFAATTNSAVSGTAGNSAVYTATAADGSVLTATVSAWNATLATSGANAGKYVVSQAYLGRYTDGLGVTSTTDAPAGFGCGTAGSCGAQQIDNVGGYDFLQLSFSLPVTLSSFTRVSSGTANGSTNILGGAVTDYDDDFSYGTGATLSSGMVLTTLASLMQTNVGGNGACGGLLVGLTGCNDTSALTGDAAAKDWFLGASIGTNLGGDNIADSFKALGLNVTAQTAAVPETSTWTMMILGFGGVGYLIRRRRTGLLRLLNT